MSYVSPNAWRAAMGYSELSEPNPYDLPCEDCGHLASKHLTFREPLRIQCTQCGCVDEL